MSNNQANKLMAEANELAVAWGGLFTPCEEKRAAARNKFIQAATLYRADSNFINAVTAYQRAADMSHEIKDNRSYADDLSCVLNATMKCENFDSARSIINKLYVLYLDQNRTSQAARVCQMFGEWKLSIGNLTQDQRKEQETYLEKAMTLYRNEGSLSIASGIHIKILESRALNGDYLFAADGFEKIGSQYLDNNLLQGAAKRYFFLSLLCQIAMLNPENITEQTLMIRSKFEKIMELDTQFNKYTQEYILISNLLTAFDNMDIDEYERAQREYSNICAVDTLKAGMLLLGKNALKKALDINSC